MKWILLIEGSHKGKCHEQEWGKGVDMATIGSLQITNINGHINANVIFLFKTSHAALMLKINFYVCVYVSVYVRNSQSPY